MKYRILIIDDDESIRKVLEYTLTEDGHEVLSAGTGEEGLSLVPSRHPHVVITDLKLPGKDGMRVLEEVKTISPETEVIVLTAFGTIERAVEAMKKGAFHYLTKPFNRDELTLTVSKALRMKELEGENLRLRQELSETGTEDIIACSHAMTRVLKDVGKVAPTDATVLITGESGTGKELVAKAIHRMSRRRTAPFVVVNCAAIPRELLESELFGHEQGAFTGAIRQKKGKFELADGGTIFLDEIADMDSALQAKLLRVLQEREVERLGGKGPFAVDVRILAATNSDLKDAMARGSFREDLYYRLSVVPIRIPSMRERREDIPPLIEHFFRHFEPGTKISVATDAMNALCSYSWPGNVRELRNLCERIVILRKSETIGVHDLPQEVRVSPEQRAGQEKPSEGVPLPDQGISLEEAEKSLILQALQRSRWNQTRAAELLRIPRHVLIYRMEKFGLREKAHG